MGHAYVFSSASSNFREDLDRSLTVSLEIPAAALLVHRCAAALDASWQSALATCSEAVEYKDDPRMTSLWNSPAILLRHVPIPAELNVPVAGPLLCVYQLLQVLPLLNQDDDSALGCLGICLGLLPAVAFAAAKNELEFIQHSVEVVKASFWISFRCEARRRKDNYPFASHSLAIKASVDEITPKLPTGTYISAISSLSSITISGDPVRLKQLQKDIPGASRALPIFGLYHDETGSAIWVDLVVEDLSRECIAFPSIASLRLPIRSSSTGLPLKDVNGTLARQITELILSDCVRWIDVIAECRNSTALDPVTVVAIGPGTKMAVDLVSALPGATMVRPSLDARMGSDDQDCIAVVGMACRLPGASNVDELWDLLLSQTNTVEEVPASRFDVHKYYNPPGNPSRPNTMRTKWGNFVKEADFAAFDHEFFATSPREAQNMDPQQRMILHVSYEALEDAGYVPDSTPSNNRETFGCFVGMVTDDYVQNLATDIDVYYSPGTLRAFTSGRISHHFDWKGNNTTYDTACASSVSALHAAVRSLTSGDCNAALVGGVHLVTGPLMYIGLDRAHFLSPTGQCKSFDAAGDGYCRSEGCVVVILKRLADAISEGDRIHGVIRACEVANNAHSQSITRPDPAVQSRMLSKACMAARIRPAEVSVVEAHAAGTQAGDPVEVEAVLEALMEDRHSRLFMTSIKGNIGHTEPASGLASLVKVLLMTKYRTIPAQVGLKTLNPAFPVFNPDLLSFPISQQTWSAPRRLAIINNFGAAGTVGTMVVENWDERRAPPCDSVRRIIVVSAKSSAAFELLQNRLADALLARSLSVSDVSLTTTARRRHYAYRGTYSAFDPNELAEKLKSSNRSVKVDSTPALVFCFSGQGAETEPAQLAFCQSAAYTAAMAQCARAVNRLELPNMQSPEMRKIVDLFSVEYSLYRMWRSWGVTPACLLGHSFGEYVAACAAEVMSVEDALQLICFRLDMMLQYGKRGTMMLAVRMDPKELPLLLVGFPDVEVACYNGLTSFTLSGSCDELEACRKLIEDRNLGKSVPLDVPIAFHSPAVDPILDHLRDHAKGIWQGSPCIPVMSSVTGTYNGAYNSDYWPKHCRQPVQFNRAIGEIKKSFNKTAWLELGPRRSVVSFVTEAPCLSSFSKGEDPWESLLHALGELFTLGVDVDWSAFHTDTNTRGNHISLPSYPFNSSNLYTPYKTQAVLSEERTTNTREPALALPNSNGKVSVLDLEPYRDIILGHQVAGAAICPATLYTELATAHLDIPAFTLNLMMHAPLTAIDSLQLKLIIDARKYEFRSSHGIKLYASGNYEGADMDIMSAQFELLLRQIGPRMTTVRTEATEMLERKTFYAAFSKLVAYGDMFQGVRKIWISGQEAVASIRVEDLVRSALGAQHCKLESVLLDALIHSAGFLVNLSGFCIPGTGFLANRVHEMRLHRSRIFASESFEIFTSFHFIETGAVALANVYILANESLVGVVTGIEFKRIPLTILRTILGQPDSVTHAVAAPVSKSASAAPETFMAVLKESLRINHLDTHSKFADLGLDSLMMIELVGVLSAKLPDHHFPTDFFFRYPTVADALSAVQTRIDGASGDTPDITSDSQATENGQSRADILCDILRQHLSVEELDMDASFAALGVDSLLSIELSHAVGAAFPHLRIGPEFFVTYTTPRACLQYIRQADSSTTSASSPQSLPISLTSSATDSSASLMTDLVKDSESTPDFSADIPARPMLLLQTGPANKAPLILIHDGSGTAASYASLGPLDRRMYGVNNPGFRHGRSIQGVDAAADLYSEYIREQHFEGPVILGGWSMGGLIAYELACRHPKLVLGVLLIDSPPPGLRHMRSSTVPLPAAQNKSMRDLVARQFEVNAPVLSLYSPGSIQQSTPFCLIRAVSPFGAGAGDSGTAESWLARRDNTKSDIQAWMERLGKRVQGVFDTPGNHFEIFQAPFVQDLSCNIRRALEAFEGPAFSTESLTAVSVGETA